MVIGNIFFQSLCLMKAAKPSAHNRFFPISNLGKGGEAHMCRTFSYERLNLPPK